MKPPKLEGRWAWIKDFFVGLTGLLRERSYREAFRLTVATVRIFLIRNLAGWNNALAINLTIHGSIEVNRPLLMDGVAVLGFNMERILPVVEQGEGEGEKK